MKFERRKFAEGNLQIFEELSVCVKGERAVGRTEGEHTRGPCEFNKIKKLIDFVFRNQFK